MTNIASTTRLFDDLLARGQTLTDDRRPTTDAYRHALMIACGIIEGLTDPDAEIRALQLHMFHVQRAAAERRKNQ